MSVRSGLAASGHRDRLVTLYNIILKFIIIVQISNLLINEVREDPRLFHDADGSIKGVVTKMQWYSLSERSTGSDRGTPSTGASTGIGADNQPILATCNLF